MVRQFTPSPQNYAVSLSQERGGLVDAFRHGRTKGTNYLFIDGHVELQLPPKTLVGLDSWEVVGAK